MYAACICLYRSVGRLQELCKGGDLLTTYHFRSEQDAANIISKVTNAVRYMHDRNIAVSGAMSEAIVALGVLPRKSGKSGNGAVVRSIFSLTSDV